MRNGLALLLILVAGVLTLPAALATWEQRVLMNEDRFVAIGNDVLSKDAVQRELAREIAKEISSAIGPGVIPGLGTIPGLGNISNDPTVKDLTNLLGSVLGLPATTPTPTPKTPAAAAGKNDTQSIVEPIVLDVVRSLPNSPFTEIPLRATQNLMVTAVRSDAIRPEDDNIVLDLSETLTQLAGGLGAGIIPKNSANDAGEVVLMKRSSMAPVFRWARRFDGNAIPLSLLPIGVLAVGLFLATDRGRYLIYAGLALAVSSGVWILLAKGPIKTSILDRATLEASSRGAANVAYDVVIGSFVQQELIVVGAGAVLVIIGLVLSASTKSPARPRGTA